MRKVVSKAGRKKGSQFFLPVISRDQTIFNKNETT